MKTHKNAARVLALAAAMLCTLALMAGCAAKATNSDIIENAEQLNSSKYTICVHQGSAAALVATDKFPNASFMYQSSVADSYLAVQQKKCDAFIYEELYLKYAVASDALDGLSILPGAVGSTDIAVGISPSREDLLSGINAFIRQIKSDGTFDDMYSRWVEKAYTEMPEIAAPTSPTMTIKVGTSGLIEPMNYYDKNNNLTGFDVEFIKRMGAYLNVDIQLEAMSFDALVASLQSGRLDAVVSDLNVTDERKEVILMSEPYMSEDISLLVCSDRLNTQSAVYNEVDELDGKKIGIVAGSSYGDVVQARLPQAQIVNLESYSDAILAIKNNKVDAYICDEPIAKLQLLDVSGIKYLPERMTDDSYAYMVAKDNTQLAEKINAAIAELKAEGVLDALEDEWINGVGTQEVNANPDADTSKGVLNVAASTDQAPFTYTYDNVKLGYDMELITRIAEKMGYKLNITMESFETMMPAIMTGNYDVAIGCITVTPERAETVLFTDPVYSSGTVCVVLNGESSQKGFWEGISDSFKRTFITEHRWKLLAKGLLVTIWLSVASAVLGTLLGFVASFPLRSKKWYGTPARAASSFLSGMPLVLILMVFYYIIFKNTALPAMWIGIFGFTLDFGNTVAGLLNTGILALDKGQIDAAEAMGYNKWQILFKITLPQVAYQMFSQYEGAIINLVKGTSIIGYITVEDLTKAGDVIRSRTYEAFFPLIVTAVIYFILANLFVLILEKAGAHIDPKNRPRRVKGVNEHD